MPADRVVVSDTSPLLNLALIERLDLLESQFETVRVPQRVWNELTAGEDGLAELRALRNRGTLTTVSVARSELYVELGSQLDVGETAAITHAVEHDADLVLLDERDGRRVARRHDLHVTGVIGILLRGVRDGSVDIREELGSLREAGFWIGDDLYADAVQRAENLD